MDAAFLVFDLNTMNELITTQPPKILADNFCRQCGCGLMPADNYCGECGTGCRELIEIVDPTSSTSVGHAAIEPSSVVAKSDGQESINAVVNNRLAVIGIIALIGPLGLPALWFSRRFSKPTKIITTTAYLLMTIVLPFAAASYWLDYSLRPLLEVFGK